MFQIEQNVRIPINRGNRRLVGGRYQVRGLIAPYDRMVVSPGLSGLDGFWDVVKNFGFGVVKTVSGGMYDPAKNRFYAPFSGGQVRNLMQGFANTATLGLVRTDKFFDSRTMRTIGNIGAGLEAAAVAGFVGAGAMGSGPLASTFGTAKVAGTSLVPSASSLITTPTSLSVGGPGVTQVARLIPEAGSFVSPAAQSLIPAGFVSPTGIVSPEILGYLQPVTNAVTQPSFWGTISGAGQTALNKASSFLDTTLKVGQTYGQVARMLGPQTAPQPVGPTDMGYGAPPPIVQYIGGQYVPVGGGQPMYQGADGSYYGAMPSYGGGGGGAGGYVSAEAAMAEGAPGAPPGMLAGIMSSPWLLIGGGIVLLLFLTSSPTQTYVRRR